MFCFCLQSSLLKLQALEADGGGPSSLGSSPEDSPQPPGSSKELPRRRSPCAAVGGWGHGEKDGGGGSSSSTLALCHGRPSDENSPPALQESVVRDTPPARARRRLQPTPT
ncbi:hypothetical protein NHX12_025360 [Muraenolepis orangiensis]|uniref:Uncharacterized protein n=1 Tax=Muraenolepis orangiensis TaxID=630683 RepID=A0A9Q0ELX6_9TELE|nr:hypothetical protein NHX12_025360 [Muraenolepis orangiensis]